MKPSCEHSGNRKAHKGKKKKPQAYTANKIVQFQ